MKFTDLNTIKQVALENGKTLQVLIFTGKRDTGKSHAFKTEVVNNFMNSGETFVYMRRTAGETDRGKVGKYWRDFNGKKLMGLTDSKYNIVSTYGDTINIGYREAGKYLYKEEFGEHVYLAATNRTQKSVAYPEKCTTIIYEEAITDTVYLEDEPELMFNFMSTVFRGRQGCVYMCGNETTKYFPYMWEWGLGDLNKQPQGTLSITTYSDADENGIPFTINIGVYRCRDTEGHKSKMAFGALAKKINTIEASKEYPLIGKDKATCVYKIRLIDKGCQFIIKLVEIKGELGLHIVNLNGKFPVTDEQRIIYTYTPQKADFNPLHTTNFIDCGVEDYIIKLLRDKTKIAYEDNYTGDMFNMSVKNSSLLFRW